MEAIDIYDYINIKEFVKLEKKPLFIERNDGNKIALVLTPEAKIYYKKRGFQVFILDELFDKLLSYETFEEQKEMIESIFKVVNTFEGQVT